MTAVPTLARAALSRGRLTAVLVFVVGLLIGLALFMPWAKIWESGLRSIPGGARGVGLSWAEIVDADMLGCRVRDLKISFPQGRLTLPEAEVRLGLVTPLTVVARTGPELTARLGWGKTLALDGGLETAALGLEPPLKGRVNVVGELGFDGWGGPPTSGRLDLASASLALPSGLSAQDMSAVLSLAGQRLNIEKFQAAKPVPLEAQGNVDLVWGALPSSTGSINGTVAMGGQKQPFQRSGRLSSLFGGL